MNALVTDQPLEAPPAAWALACACLGGQVLMLAEQGAQSEDAILGSMLLGALVVGWVAHGVLTGRTVRLAFVWILFVVAAIANTVGVVDHLTGWGFVHLVASVAQLACLAWFTRTDYFAGQRAKPRHQRPPLGALIAVAIVAGALGGVIGATDSSPTHVQVDF